VVSSTPTARDRRVEAVIPRASDSRGTGKARQADRRVWRSSRTLLDREGGREMDRYAFATVESMDKGRTRYVWC
ncbi:MAG TPA: hypothetical protein VFV02_17250, partial [Acidimicrobiales bacterium]|nr:hypothetical protein [Acidimicrobiales bacterium]